MMELSVSKNVLQRALALLGKAIEKNSTMPILENVHIDAGDQIELRATDLGVDVTTVVDGQVFNPGKCTVNLKKTLALVKACGNDQLVNIATDGDQVLFSCGDFSTSIDGISFEDFPKKHLQSNSLSVTVLTKDLLAASSNALFAASKDRHRYPLHGALVEVCRGKINIVATDGHRMSATTLRVSKKLAPGAHIVPRKTLEILCAIKGAPKNVTIRFLENRIGFDFAKISIISRIVDAEFPNYRRAIPEQDLHCFEFVKKDAFAAVKRLATFTTKTLVMARVQLSEERIVFRVNNPVMGAAEEILDTAYSGPSIQLGINIRYLKDFLQKNTEEKVRFQFTGPEAPYLLSSVGDRNYQHVIMPMRLQG